MKQKKETEPSVSVILYLAEQEWIKQVNKILIDYIPGIQALIPKLKEYNYSNKFEYGGADRYAWSGKGRMVLQTQNFRFNVKDNDEEFSIEYRVLDEYTREHCGKMYAVSPDAHFIQLFKKLEENNIISYLRIGNYDFFAYFIGEIECLINSLVEEP